MSPSLLRNLVRDEEAVTASEYAMMLALIIFAVIASVTAVGNSTASGWGNNVNRISAATTAAGS